MFEIRSVAFTEGGEIPTRHTCQGEDLSPPLAWSGAPAGTKSLALVVDDPDAPDPAAPRAVLSDSSSLKPSELPRLTECAMPLAVPRERPCWTEYASDSFTVSAHTSEPAVEITFSPSRIFLPFSSVSRAFFSTFRSSKGFLWS